MLGQADSRCALADPAEHRRIGVDNGERTGPDPGQGGEPGNRDRDQVVVAKEDNVLAFKRAGLVQLEYPVQLSGDGAVGLVELGPGLRFPGRVRLKLDGKRFELGRDDQAEPAALGALGA